VGNGLNLPAGVAVDQAGDVFIADSNNNRRVEVMLDFSRAQVDNPESRALS
jgi:hypothetical protein